ncbi:GNAT family N-acetyltransferase [Allokutzneria sp. NRRL B-24872]|uniref:GNAT family N-acetyltransferase n=1 Tax=Allokutzneria sp. NRRL B-24872 TaxID=1137961 RepID=UPI001AF01697|nr:GNAT family N-acetyltransferase [Allokutzneria sp. NRRL B-24872]
MIAELTEVAQYDEVAELFGEIWAADVAESPVPAELMCAFQLTGNYVAGAYFGGELVGAAVGFFDSSGGLHSHVAGVRASWQGRGVGLALKLHQRDWALERGVKAIHWTFDPLVRRNAHFNLVKLGARPVRYLPNFYGPLADGESDRFLVEWPLTAAPAPALLGAVQPLLDASLVLSDPPMSPSVTVAVPPDIEALRLSDPALADRWRLAVREALELAFAAGYSVTGMIPGDSYVLTKEGS